MKKEIEIKPNAEEVANMLFELDNEEVAQVFSIWKRLFDQEYERRKEAKEFIWIYDLNHFMLYVIDKMDDDAKDIVRSMYSNLIYKMVGDIHKEHILELHL